MTLAPDRLDRFARHIVLPELGGAGQVALSQAHIVLVGCGGIGSPALQYLAGAGVGKLTLIDSDEVDLSNLQRQTIFGEADIGRSKAEAAAAWVGRFDGAIEVRAITTRLGGDNAAQLLDGASLVLDGCDNFATRLAVSDACVKAGVPLTSAAIGRFQGQVANFAGHRPGESCTHEFWVPDGSAMIYVSYRKGERERWICSLDPVTLADLRLMAMPPCSHLMSNARGTARRAVGRRGAL